MKKLFKPLRYSLMIGGFLITTISHLEAATCPTLNRDQVRTLCRWDGLKNLPFLKIEAKKITIDGATLQNKHDSCREKDSIKQFLTKSATMTFKGTASKDFKEPNDQSKVLCIYTIDNEAFGFSAEGVPHPNATAKKETPSVTPQKKHITGFDYTGNMSGDAKLKEIEIKPSEPPSPSSKPPQRTPPPAPNNGPVVEQNLSSGTTGRPLPQIPNK